MTPGETLAIFVGGAGRNGGWNGGGSASLLVGAPGGGASDVRQGGDALTDRVVVGGGGGGGGVVVYTSSSEGIPGGTGGGLEGGGDSTVSGGTQTGPGTGPFVAQRGALGVGGAGQNGASGGGGGLYGGAGGHTFEFIAYPAGGGSGLGDAFVPGSSAGDGWVTLTYEVRHSITPYGAIAVEDSGTPTTIQVPVFLSPPSTETVTVDWATVDGQSGPGLASSGSDFVDASGTVTFAPGDTVEYVSIEVLDDDEDEPPLLWGEWGLISFSDPAGATIDTATFFGVGLFVIVDDD